MDAFRQIESEKGTVYPLVIGGERITTNQTITSYNPANKEVLGSVCACTAELADQAIHTANKAFAAWSHTTVDERVRTLRKLATLLIENRFYIDAWNVLESGKNWGEADGELCEQLDFINSYVMHIQNLDKGLELVPTDEHTKCIYIPIGVGVALPPWNFPVSLSAGMVVSAVVTGNTICVKPSSDTPIVAYKLQELYEKAGIPAGVVNYIPGQGSEIGDLLVEHPLTRFINFTGSKAVGCRIYEHAAKVSPGQKWLKRVISSAFTFQGQKCSACSRAIVLDDVYDAFVEAVVEETKKLKESQGPGQENCAIGPVVNKASFDKITGYVEIAREEGNIVYGGTYSETRENVIKAKKTFHVGNLYFNRKSTAAVVLQHPFGGFNLSGTDAKTGTADYLRNFMNLKSITEDLTE